MKEFFIVTKENAGKRLDCFLSENLTEITRSQIKKSIEDKLTLVNGKTTKAGKILKESDEILSPFYIHMPWVHRAL